MLNEFQQFLECDLYTLKWSEQCLKEMPGIYSAKNLISAYCAMSSLFLACVFLINDMISHMWKKFWWLIFYMYWETCRAVGCRLKGYWWVPGPGGHIYTGQWEIRKKDQQLLTLVTICVDNWIPFTWTCLPVYQIKSCTIHKLLSYTRSAEDFWHPYSLFV